MIATLQRVHLDKLFAMLAYSPNIENLASCFLKVDILSSASLDDKDSFYEDLVISGKKKFDKLFIEIENRNNLFNYKQKGDPILFTEHIESQMPQSEIPNCKLLFSIILTRKPFLLIK